jgi:hypothetical protein
VFLGRIGVRGDVETSRVEASQVLIASISDRSQYLEVVDRLEEIRLAVTVVADDDGTIGRKLEIHTLQIPEIANRDSLELDAFFDDHLSVTFP